jgi:hypothetical protein
MKPEELVVAARVEEADPTDRIRGTVVSVDPSGMFVVKYDNGDYLAFDADQLPGFTAIPEKPIPGPAMDIIHHLHKVHGRTPPKDIAKLGGVPRARPPIGEKSVKPALTRDIDPPTIGA